MKNAQQELPLPLWGGARKNAGRPRKASRPQVPHGPRPKFRNAALHVTVRVREDVWNLRSKRCFAALRQAFERGCQRFGLRIIHFSVQGNHIHMIVEATDRDALARAMKGPQVRMARALNKVMNRTGSVFADRYHAHILRTPRETANAVKYVLDNWKLHGQREGWPVPHGVDPYCSAAWRDRGAPVVAQPIWWMLCVGAGRAEGTRRAA